MTRPRLRYEPTWDSLDRHRAPEWFHDAKLGLFVHYSPTWFGEEGDRPVPENYDATAWVDAATDAGAQYLVFTSKHHDGFCNWPSEHAEFGAEELFGPRDVVTPLVEAARREGLRVGFYYSWLDDHHPAYPDRTSYVEEYAHAQLEELWELYRPSLLWGDGEWDHPADHWESREAVAHYYDAAEAEQRDVCVNDRLGSDTRYYYVRGLDGSEPGAGRPHGDYWTPEHQTVDGVLDHKWEACETMHDGWSWTESPNWREAGDVVALLVDVVSKNGNLLLNVGPGPDGTLSERERELLSELGDWLSVNGEAIYGTRPLRSPDGDATFVPDVDWEDPAATWRELRDRIDAEGPVRTTRKGDVAYALHVGWPGDRLRVEDVRPRPGAAVELLGHDGALEWERDGGDLLVDVPDLAPDERPCDHAYAVRVPLPVR